MTENKKTLLVTAPDGSKIRLDVYPESADPDSIDVIPGAEAEENGEAEFQLKEECTYEYRLPDGLLLDGDSRIVRPSKMNPSSGRLTPGIFVGTLKLDIIDDTTLEKEAEVALEVRSTKTGYRTDYRNMLEYITDKCTDLLMQYSSPAAQSFQTDFSEDAQTLYQRFAFIKSILDTDEFQNALQRIIHSPVTAWVSYHEESDIRSAKRMDRSAIRQFASRKNRIKLPAGHPFSSVMESIPASIIIAKKKDTPDTPENRFIKHALEEFNYFCARLRGKFAPDSRAYKEALHLEEILEGFLSHSVFKEISRPVTLPLNSPVLQRKEGYREVLKVWLMFDLAAKLVWKGGEDVYEAGKRDVAVLYEYWLFFRLLELCESIFDIKTAPVAELIEPTRDGLSLKLKAGKHIPLQGTYVSGGRRLNIEFSYNRTFSETAGKYPASGSWTRRMRPDYTLSMWPADFTQKEAESQELIVHIHFDAKYKMDSVKDLFGTDDLDEEKNEERQGTYKRADLLKMHAYKDAVRRTAGAYVLYPGDESKQWRGFHEIIPGLGAFAVKPNKSHSGIADIRKFVLDVLEHFTNRISQRERLSYRLYDIHKTKPESRVHEPLPETYLGTRVIPPSDTSVLVGYSPGGAKYDWVIKNESYNVRMDSTRGSLRLDPMKAGASYLLLHKDGKLETGDIWRITEEGPRVFSKKELLAKHYPDPSQDFYLVYKIEKVGEMEFSGMNWDISRLEAYKSGRASAIPFAVTLAELMRVRV